MSLVEELVNAGRVVIAKDYTYPYDDKVFYKLFEISGVREYRELAKFISTVLSASCKPLDSVETDNPYPIRITLYYCLNYNIYIVESVYDEPDRYDYEFAVFENKIDAIKEFHRQLGDMKMYLEQIRTFHNKVEKIINLIEEKITT